MTDQATIEKLKRIAQHYTGKDDVRGLLDTQEWKQVYQRNLAVSNGDENKAIDRTINAMGTVKETTVLPAHFLASRSWEKGRNGKPGALTEVLLPSGENGVVFGMAFDGTVLQPIMLDNVQKTTLIAAGTTKYSLRDATVVGESHKEPVPPINGFPASNAAREMGKGSTRINGRAFGQVVSGHVLDPDVEGSGGYIRIFDADSYSPGLQFNINCPDGESFQVHVSPEKFEDVTGAPLFDSGEDYIRSLIVGQDVIVSGLVDVLTMLSEEKAKEWDDAVQAGLHENWSVQDNNIIRPFQAGPYTVQGGYVQRDGDRKGQFIPKVDVKDLGFRPRITVGSIEKSTGGTYNDESWWCIMGQEKGEPPISSLGQTLLGLLKTEDPLEG